MVVVNKIMIIQQTNYNYSIFYRIPIIYVDPLVYRNFNHNPSLRVDSEPWVPRKPEKTIQSALNRKIYRKIYGNYLLQRRM